jgi:hypothetical protein
MAKIIDLAEALKFVDAHGVVLISAKGSVPRLTEYIVGETIKGSWWAHPQGRAIFTLLNAVENSGDVLICRLIDGKLTMVHRRLWPSLVRAAKHFAPEQLAQVVQEHTASGKHVNREIAFPDWVPAEVLTTAVALTEQEAITPFAKWTQNSLLYKTQ